MRPRLASGKQLFRPGIPGRRRPESTPAAGSKTLIVQVLDDAITIGVTTIFVGGGRQQYPPPELAAVRADTKTAGYSAGPIAPDVCCRAQPK